MGLRIPIFALIALLAVGLAAPAAGSAADAKGSGRLQAALDHWVEQTPGASPGASIVLRKGSRETFIRSGVANVETGGKFAPKKQMRIASVSKAFSGAVALTLVDEGELDLDEKVADRIPWIPAAWGEVTLRQLLDHTSGVPSFTKNSEFLAYFGSHLHGKINKRGLMDYVLDEDLEFPAGSDYEYSNSDNILIAIMAERATGVGYGKLLRRQVTDPLGMRKTTLPPSFRMAGPRIEGYEVDPIENVTECCSMAFVSSSGGIVSTPRALSQFISGYGGGGLFDQSVRSEQFQWVQGGGSEPPGPGANSAGLGIFRYQLKCDGTVFGHTGNFPGYTQFIATDRSGKRSVVVSANRQLAPDANGVDAPGAFRVLRRIYERAACTALRQ